MKYGRIYQKKLNKYFEVADNVFVGINPYHGISWANAGFINRGKGLVYDTFFDPPHAYEMKELYQELSGRELPGYVVNSHGNADHVFGNVAFKGSCFIMHEKCEQEHIAENPELPKRICRLGAGNPELNPGEQYLAQQWVGFDMTDVEWFSPDIEVKGDMTLRLDDTEVDILNVAPAHSGSDLLLYLPKEKVLFTGDIIFNGCTAYSEKGVLNWVHVLDRIIHEIKPEIVVPGHGKICTVDFVQEQRDYLMNLIDEFNKYYNDEITPLELSKKIDVSKFLHWIQPERVFPSVLAMVNERRGLSMVPDWNVIPVGQNALREYNKERYGDRIKPWDPYSVWAED